MIYLQKINKQYKSKRALCNFDLQVKAGEIHALLGPNGSGKTTTVGVILSMLKYDGIVEIKIPNNKIGVSTEKDIFFERLSVYENLKFIAVLKKIPLSEIERIIELLNLETEINISVKTLSKGNRKKVSLAFALMGNQELYIFDEPMSGLDFDNIILFRKIINELKEKGKTVLLCSHILSEAEKMCTNFSFIFRGKRISVIEKMELIKKYDNLENAYHKIIPKTLIKYEN